MLDLTNLSSAKCAHDEIDAALLHRILVIDAWRIGLERGYGDHGRAIVVRGRARVRCRGGCSRGSGSRSTCVRRQDHIDRDIAALDIEDGLP